MSLISPTRCAFGTLASLIFAATASSAEGLALDAAGLGVTAGAGDRQPAPTTYFIRLFRRRTNGRARWQTARRSTFS